jgi:adenine deaminase
MLQKISWVVETIMLTKPHVHISGLPAICYGIPLSEQHIHIEGTLSPRMMQKFAQRNNITLHFRSFEELQRAYQFTSLGDFLALYYLGCKVLVKEVDFYELTLTYLKRVARQNVRHVEIFFDPQTHLNNGVQFSNVINGIHRAIVDARALGISSLLIMCFLRDLPPDEAMRVLEESLQYKDKIVGIGLDSAERDYPPSLFETVFAKARSYGYRVVAHAGEEGPADYVWQALQLLKVERVDHGVRSVDDPQLLDHLARHGTPLTMCPFSSKRLCVVKSLKEYPLRFMLEHDICALVNSDDPAYFGGYVKTNLLNIARIQKLTIAQIFQLARNSFRAAFLSDEEKSGFLAEVDRFEQSLEV